MKNVHVLSTDKPSRLCKDEFGKFYVTELMESKISFFKNQHIYITNDEEIKEGDLWLNLKTNDVDKCTHKSEVLLYNSEKYKHIKKIVLTNNEDLIKDGVQAIDDEFLEWFVKNPSCEEVLVTNLYGDFNPIKYEYKIIISKEEPKQETLEEAAEKFRSNNPGTMQGGNNTKILNAFKNGAKWQQERMYSEEDLMDFGAFIRIEDRKEKRLFLIQDYFKVWFNQFKKK